MMNVKRGLSRRPAPRRADVFELLVGRLDTALLGVAYFYSHANQVFGEYMISRGIPENYRTLFRALRAVRDTPPPVSIRKVQLELGLSHSATSRLIDRCVADGLVDRADSVFDRRHATLGLTPAGRHAVSEVETARQEVVAALVAGWPLDELDALTTELERLGVDFARLRKNPPKASEAPS